MPQLPAPPIEADQREVVLLVEDDENDVFFAERALKLAGTRAAIHVVRDGQQAIDYLAGQGNFSDRRRHPFPGLMLLDLKLPYRSGLDVLAWKRDRPALSGALVVMLTGSNEHRDVVRARELGANAYHIKPVTPAMIRELSSTLDLGWLAGAPASAAVGH